jgi:hypothetical protein
MSDDPVSDRIQKEIQRELDRLRADHERTMGLIKRMPEPSEADKLAVAEMTSREGWQRAIDEAISDTSPEPRKLMLRVILLSMALPVVLSLLGPIYYGYMGEHYWRVLVWAGACTILGLWFYRTSFAAAFNGASYSSAVKILNVVAIIAFMAFCFVAGDSAVYLIVRSISR